MSIWLGRAPTAVTEADEAEHAVVRYDLGLF
jgi:hypothetical protein